MVYAVKLRQRFFKSVEKMPNGCWEWRGGKSAAGYGVIRVGSRSAGTSATVTTHRMSWAIHNGFVMPSGAFVCHKCDNPPCCNPDHLFLGTHLDNMRDLTAKGRRHNAYTKNPPTHCKRGHEFSEKNTRINEHGNRCCRQCANWHQRRYTAAKRALRHVA